MFCDCLNEPLKKEPNVNICPVCTAQPGVLPVINKEAVEMVIKTGLALNCKITSKTWFERKNYFYPDLPKGYQISQYEAPICKNGKLAEIRIQRVHLEEDTGKLLHDRGDLPAGRQGHSLVDFNRAGIPLMELVTEPDIQSANEARKFAQELQIIFRYLGISDADMEKGQMRVEANVSLNKGTKAEVKNLNSFKAVERAIDYEIKRQREILESDEKVIHETRGWSETKQKTFSQRTKETSEDYRYFPEPDLPPLQIFPKNIKMIKAEIPELPASRRKRFKKEYKIPEPAIETLTTYKYLGDFFEEAVSELRAWLKSGKTCLPVGKVKTDIQPLIKLSANYIITEFPKYITGGKDVKFTPENFAELIYLIFIGEISSSGAQEVLKEMFRTGADPSQIIEKKEIRQVSQEKDLEEIVEKIIKNNPAAARDYKKGKENSLQFLIGQVMRESKGRANPQVVEKILRKKLK
jgi:aspartyl-tRNA(Asn)/glutamyl-tRNA(Gln) amidotransferase subunit B